MGAGLTNHVFVDVDGTLLIWPTRAGSPGPGEVPKVNQPLVDQLKAWKVKTGGTLVIWTRGGTAHAEMARKLCGLDAICVAKPEVTIDDADAPLLAKKLRIVKPHEFKA